MSEDYRMKNETTSSTKITENEGWNAMRDLLDKTMPVEPNPRTLIRWSPAAKVFMAAAIVSVTAVIITSIMLYNHKESAWLQAPVHHPAIHRQQISKIHPVSVSPTDSFSQTGHDHSGSQINYENTRNPEPNHLSANERDFARNGGAQYSSKKTLRNNAPSVVSGMSTIPNENANSLNNKVETTGSSHREDVPDTNDKPDNAVVLNQSKEGSVYAADARKGDIDTLSKAAIKNLPSANESIRNDVLARKKNNGCWKIFEKTHFGLGWYFNVPLNGTGNYFTDTDNKNRPYLALIPSLWISRTLNEKLSINAEFRPYALHGGKQSSINVSGKDSSMIEVTEYKRLVKSSGFDLRSGIEYRLKGNWKVGLGLEWTKTDKILVEKKTFDNKGNFLSDEYISAGSSDSVFSAIRSSSFSLNVSGGYSFKWFDTGLIVRLPVVTLSAQQQFRNEPFSVDLYVKWKIK